MLERRRKCIRPAEVPAAAAAGAGHCELLTAAADSGGDWGRRENAQWRLRAGGRGLGRGSGRGGFRRASFPTVRGGTGFSEGTRVTSGRPV